MKVLKELLPVDRASPVPVYLQIANGFIRNILNGTFRKGKKLLGSRETGILLGINRMTVVAAYQELEAQGWIEMSSRKGTFVKVNQPMMVPKNIGDLSTVLRVSEKAGFKYDVHEGASFPLSGFPQPGKIILRDGGYPDVRLAPVEDLVRRIRSLSKLSVNQKFLMYGSAQGTLFLREMLANFLCDTRGLSITAANILITKGAQMGIYISSSMLVKPGDEVIVGAPGYLGAHATFQQAGARVMHVAVDEAGIDVGAIEKICIKRKVRMVYVIPHHHHPTSATLSPERRLHLLKLAAKFKFAILEDDYDYDFHYSGNPMMPMASLDRNGNVIYVGTLTKSLAPAIRLGFMVASAEFIQAATHFRKFIDTHGDSMIENAIADLFKDGTIARHLKKSVRLYRERRDYFCDLLKYEIGNDISFKIPEGGMAVWTTFLKRKLTDISASALGKGLILGDGKDYNTEKIDYNSVGLGFASLDFNEQKKAIEILKKVLHGPPFQGSRHFKAAAKNHRNEVG